MRRSLCIRISLARNAIILESSAAPSASPAVMCLPTGRNGVATTISATSFFLHFVTGFRNCVTTADWLFGYARPEIRESRVGCEHERIRCRIQEPFFAIFLPQGGETIKRFQGIQL